ncbi:MAG: FAD-dependent oxidoreductase [Rhodospirillaceae bacterium]|nr:FAD-dependent oxidoreductase [Rhodospirillaceae bacterium]
MQSTCDLVIIGAGAAGLAAARAATAAGLNIELVEAMERIGGRAYTDQTSLPAPFDHGCQWLHSASINPFTKVADQLDFRYWTNPFEIRIHDGKWWLNDQLTAAFWDFLNLTYDRIDQAAAAGDDRAAATFIDQDNPWAGLFARNYSGYVAASPAHSSTYDTGRYRNTNEDWPVENGYGALIAAHFADIPVNLGCPVKSIDWGGEEVMVGTKNGMIFCRAVLVTTSIATLQAERIKFFPLLPDWKQAAIGRIGMGHAEKVGFWFKRDPFVGQEMHFAMLNGPGVPDAAFQVHPYGRPMATLFASGHYARDLFAKGEDAAVAEAKTLLGEIFGQDLLREIVAAKATQWVANPWVGGAYSFLQPGGGEARAELARDVDQRLFFAGEATSPDAFSTAHGAHQSGVDAVAAIVKALGH